ncbi:hypothetical protein BGZ95_002652 [Linnemannia exigua]|uniref:Structure-specific endonuclease subunit SLX4 n=1 Tax=Linnemannia exigua TaxID=604196 RepID=A0AAD4H9V3_9FUNG|nr:hypothetical protein BGZ95_002652 [Linnemannia exigua]
MPLGMLDGDDDDDDFDSLTPPTRPRLVFPATTTALTATTITTITKAATIPDCTHSKEITLRSKSKDDQADGIPKLDHSCTVGLEASFWTLTLAQEASAEINPEQPAVTRHLISSPQSIDAGKETVMIVLDSESEGHTDVETELFAPPSSVSPDGSAQIGGVRRSQTPFRSSSGQGNKRSPPIPIAYRRSQNTQESVASSQGSVELGQEPDQFDNIDTRIGDPAPSSPVHNPQVDYTMSDVLDCKPTRTRWSLSPEIQSPHLLDLVATTTTSVIIPAETASTPTVPASPRSTIADEADDMDDDTNTHASHDIDLGITSTMQTDDYLPSTLGGDDIVECVVCGKLLTHLDSARMEYHVNNCIDEQQQRLDAMQSLELKTDIPRAPSSHGEFAGAQVDYLARVKRCPICKLEWPLKGKGKAGTVAPARKARQKVEHMKRCAKANRRTIQSVLYQVRLLKERYERSLVLGTSMDSASQDVDRESGREEENQSEEETNAEEVQPKVRRKPKVNNMVKKQVVSLADNADADFASDAIIATVHAPTPVRPKMTKLQRMQQDQQDDGLQLALAISMSMSDANSGSAAGSNSGSPSGTPGPSTMWSMTPAAGRKGVKRRKQTDRDRNETTVLPYSEVQHLIQSNVHALLFPDIDDSSFSRYSIDNENNRSTLMRTPPWGPSRFAGVADDADVEMTLSQTSEPDTTSPTKSLWSLSHLRDTRDADLQEGVSISGEMETSVARYQSGSGVTFDKEKYVTRFMRRYIQRNQDASERSKPVGSTTPGQGDSSKYTSPLWSVSRSRRLSSKEQHQEKELESVKVLKSEIVGHLDEMQRTIQKAKRVAYVKILESIERHPEAAASLTPPKSRGPISPIIIQELGEHDDGALDDDDTGILSQDSCGGPSSPLLRYSKASELKDTVPPRPLEAYSPSTSPSNKDFVEERVDSPLREALSQDLNRSCNMDDTVIDLAMDDYETYQEDDLAYTSGVLVYSPPQLSRPQTPPRLELESPPSRRAVTPYDFLDTNSPPPPPPPSQSPPPAPVVRPPKPLSKASSSRRKKTTTRIPSLPTSPSLSMAELPPPLDFAGLGYHKANELKELEEEEVAKWAEVTTPKKSRRSNKNIVGVNGNSPSARIRKALPGRSQQPQQEQEGSQQQQRRAAASASIRLDPLPSTSAVGGEGGLEELGNWPTVSQRIAARRAATLQAGDQEQQPSSSSSQPASSQTLESPRRAAAAARPVSSELVESYRKAATRARNAGYGSGMPMRYTSNLAFTQTQTASENLSQSQTGSQTPSKSAARIKAQSEAFAAEAAKAVETMRAQETMPKYNLMSIATLRMIAVGFGLKATSKKLLAEQLTAIWESVHSDTGKEDQEGEGGETVQDAGGLGNGESSSRGGRLQADSRWDEGRDEGERSARLRQLDHDDRAPSPPPFQSVDDTAPGYMSPILSDNDHTYDHMFENNDFDMDYDNSYHNFDNDSLETRSHRYDHVDLDNDAGSDRDEPFVNTKRGGGDVGSSTKSGGGSGHRKAASLYKDDIGDDAGLEADSEMSEGDEDDPDEDDSLDDASDEGGTDDDIEAMEQEEPVAAPPTLERQLLEFLSKAPHFRKQYLTYKPLDLEQVWEECSAAKIKCTRQQLRQFLDRQSIICFVPAHSTLQSWRKTRAKKQKRTHP